MDDLSHPLPLVQQCRWEGNGRYYRLHLQQDLFGAWEIVRVWGGLGSRLGNCKVEPVPSELAGQHALMREARRRERRGYRPVPPPQGGTPAVAER